jgi:branched-chain amino acid transport system substrate-binding protein
MIQLWAGKRPLLACIAFLSATSIWSGVAAQSPSPGITSDTIKIGQTMPHSGNLSSYSNISKAEDAYFKFINQQGGINGRKILFLSMDDAYSPAKTFEQTRRLVEQDEVAFLFGSLGTGTNLSVRKYLNDKGIPQIFITSGNSGWNDPAHFPWTMGFQPSYYSEGVAIGRFITKELPNAKVGLLHQADDFGRDYFRGLRDGLGDRAKQQLVEIVSYQATDPTIDSQIVTLKSANIDAFVDATSPKYTAQAIRKAAEIVWKPTHFIPSSSNSVGAVMNPAGAENGVGVIAPAFLKDPTDPQWAADPAIKQWSAFMDANLPGADKGDINYLYGYTMARALVELLSACGKDLTRQTIMNQAANLNLNIDTLLPGIKIQTTPTDYAPIEEMFLSKFDGKTFRLFGDVISTR